MIKALIIMVLSLQAIQQFKKWFEPQDFPDEVKFALKL